MLQRAAHFPFKIVSSIWVIVIWVYYMVPWAHSSPQPKQHLDWFVRFSKAHDCDRQTDRQLDHAILGP